MSSSVGQKKVVERNEVLFYENANPQGYSGGNTTLPNSEQIGLMSRQ